MVCSFYGRDVRESLNRFVREDREWTALCYPGIVVHPFLRHRLLHHHDSVLLQPENLIQGLLTVLPTLIGIHGQRKIRDLADGAYHLLVIIQTDLDLQDIELVRTLAGLFTYDFRSVDSDSESRVRCLCRIKAPDAPPWLAHQFAHKIVKGDVYSCFCGVIFRGKTVYVCEYGFELERIVELRKIHAAEEIAHTFHRLAEIWRHRGFTIACISFVIYAYLNSRSSLSGI